MSDLTPELLAELRRPFPPEVVQWKIQRNPKGNGPAVIVGFIDARNVSERLNQVVPGRWSHHHSVPVIGQKGAFVTCQLDVCGTTHTDVGWSTGASSDMDTKTMFSDALKRAAVHVGIAASLYELPEIKRWPKDLKSYGSGDNVKYFLDDDVKKGLNASYSGWLARPDVLARFGEPFGGAAEPG